MNRVKEGEQLLECGTSGGYIPYHGWAFHALGRASLLLGRLDEAQMRARRALDFCRRQPGFAAHAHHLLGDIAAHPDRFDAQGADAHYRQALALAEPRGMRPLVARCHLSVGKLARRQDRQREAQGHLITAATMCRQMDMQFWLERAKEEMR